MAITAILEIKLKPEVVERAPAEIQQILGQTRAFDGCLGVDVLEDLRDPTHLTIVERWETLDQDRAYRKWRTTDEGASTLGELLTEPPVLVKYSEWTD